MHWPKLLFFWLFINYAYYFPIILSLSHAANPRPMVARCDGSVYDVDVVFVFTGVKRTTHSLSHHFAMLNCPSILTIFSHSINYLVNGSFRNKENLQYKKTTDSVLLSLFMRTNGKCNNSHVP